MDECAMPSLLAELEQLYVELNSEHSIKIFTLQLHTLQTTNAGWGLEM